MKFTSAVSILLCSLLPVPIYSSPAPAPTSAPTEASKGVSPNPDATYWVVAGFSGNNCAQKDLNYYATNTGIDMTHNCYQFDGRTAYSVAFNGTGTFCLSLFQDANCQKETRYFNQATAGCAGLGDWKSYAFRIGSHGYAC